RPGCGQRLGPQLRRALLLEPLGARQPLDVEPTHHHPDRQPPLRPLAPPRASSEEGRPSPQPGPQAPAACFLPRPAEPSTPGLTSPAGPPPDLSRPSGRRPPSGATPPQSAPSTSRNSTEGTPGPPRGRACRRRSC